MLDTDRVSRRFRRERRSAECFLGDLKRYAPIVASYVVTDEALFLNAQSIPTTATQEVNIYTIYC